MRHSSQRAEVENSYRALSSPTSILHLLKISGMGAIVSCFTQSLWSKVKKMPQTITHVVITLSVKTMLKAYLRRSEELQVGSLSFTGSELITGRQFEFFAGFPHLQFVWRRYWIRFRCPSTGKPIDRVQQEVQTSICDLSSTTGVFISC